MQLADHGYRVPIISHGYVLLSLLRLALFQEFCINRNTRLVCFLVIFYFYY